MKTILRKSVRYLLTNDIIWSIGSILFKRIPYISFLRKQTILSANKKAVERTFSDLTVKSGIFKGLKYPKLESSGSAIYPKLLGSYEAELHPVLKEITSINFDRVIDVGCAEGYYLTGLGKINANCELIGIDISEVALSQTQNMLNLNCIEMHRTTLLKHFNIEILTEYSKKATLIICDCEGHEAKIFAPNDIMHFSKSTLLIECHDFIIHNITDKLVNLLTPTHQITIIKSEIDESKKFDFIPKELGNISTPEKLQIVSEGRPHQMNWIYALPKKNDENTSY